MSNEKNFYEDWKKMQEDFMELWFPWAPKQEEEKTSQPMWMFPGNQDFMNSMMEMWQKIMKNPGPQGIASDFFKEATKNFYTMMLNAWMPMMQVSGNIFSDENFVTEGFRQMMDFWNRGLESFDFFSKLPPLGPGREMLEKQKSMMESFAAYQELWMKALNLMQSFGVESGQRIYQDYLEALEDGKSLKNFEDFYHFWMEEIRKEYELLMMAPEFQELMKKITDAMAVWKKHSDAYMEDVLAFYPIPTMKAFDSLSESVYELKVLMRDDYKKELDELKNKVKELEEKVK